MVELVSVIVPLFSIPPPFPGVLPPVIVSPERDAVTPPSTSNTRLFPPPLTITPAAGPVIEVVKAVSLSSSWAVRVIVCWVAKTVGSKLMVAPAN